MSANRYSDAEIAAIYRVIYERRDIRHFLPDPIPADSFQRLLEAAHYAPSVGFMQPWRFIKVTDLGLRQQIKGIVEQERLNTAKALHERKDDFMRLKVEGIMDCAEVLVAALCGQRESHIFGRRTLPEMDLASVACAIQNIWLAARAEGIGMGWVSMFDPAAIRELLRMPDDSQPVAILCLGKVAQFYNQPMLQSEGWASRINLNELIYENTWKA
jgi:5,6-dimethylbenzimidazole synthase